MTSTNCFENRKIFSQQIYLALINSRINLNCIGEGPIPTQYYEKAKVIRGQ